MAESMSVEAIDSSFIPGIHITQKAYEKMMALVDNCEYEIAWFATVDVSEDGKLLTVEDTIFVPEQKVTGVTVGIKEESMSNLFKYLRETYGVDKAIEINNKMRLWGHSHVNMGVSPSGTDTNQMKEFTLDYVEGNPYFIMIILNKHKAIHVTLLDMRAKMKYVNAPYTLDNSVDPEIDAWAKEQIESNVEKYVYVYHNPVRRWDSEEGYNAAFGANNLTKKPYDGKGVKDMTDAEYDQWVKDNFFPG